MNSLRGRDIDRERDLSDYRQPRDYDRGPSYGTERDRPRDQDREISLGTGTILGIFFALALLCAVFFGFGYSMGRKSAQPTTPIADSTPSNGLFGGTKPSPGSPLSSSSKPTGLTANSATNGNSDSQQTPAPSNAAPDESSYAPFKPTPVPARSTAAVATEDASPPVVVKPPIKTVSGPAPAAVAETAMPQISPNGTLIVQVAAVSHQEDADLLLSALKNRGYAVFTRQEAQDHLLHVQVGPFVTRKDAEAMRQRLLADGYNALVK